MCREAAAPREERVAPRLRPRPPAHVRARASGAEGRGRGRGWEVGEGSGSGERPGGGGGGGGWGRGRVSPGRDAALEVCLQEPLALPQRLPLRRGQLSGVGSVRPLGDRAVGKPHLVPPHVPCLLDAPRDVTLMGVVVGCPVVLLAARPRGRIVSRPLIVSRRHCLIGPLRLLAAGGLHERRKRTLGAAAARARLAARRPVRPCSPSLWDSRQEGNPFVLASCKANQVPADVARVLHAPGHWT